MAARAVRRQAAARADVDISEQGSPEHRATARTPSSGSGRPYAVCLRSPSVLPSAMPRSTGTCRHWGSAPPKGSVSVYRTCLVILTFWMLTFGRCGADGFPVCLEGNPPQIAPQPDLNTPLPRIELHKIDFDDRRSYWLLCPNGRRAHARPGLAWRGSLHTAGEGLTMGAFPGLIVVLPGGDGNGRRYLDLWSEAMQRAFKGHYYVAILNAPVWSHDQHTPWLTQQSLRKPKAARFTTETLAADVVKDVAAMYPVDATHVFLHGVAESGTAAYACSLEAATPFRGFYILASSFRPLQLPVLSYARGRRYLLQQSPTDSITPFWMATTAEKMLTDQGAIVKVDSYSGQHGYNFDESLWDKMGSAIAWLEQVSGK